VSAVTARLALLRVVLGGVIVVQSIAPMLSPARAVTGHLDALAGFVRVLATVEVLAGALLLLPVTARAGAWLLLAVLATAIAVHLLHGETHVAWLVLAAAAAWAVRPVSRGAPAAA